MIERFKTSEKLPERWSLCWVWTEHQVEWPLDIPWTFDGRYFRLEDKDWNIEAPCFEFWAPCVRPEVT